jgi:hypothetical protein
MGFPVNKKKGLQHPLRKMYATRCTWHCPCEQMRDNMKKVFLCFKNMKPLFLDGAQFAPIWGGRHQNLLLTLS